MPSNATRPLPQNPFDDEAPTIQRAKVIDLTEELNIDTDDALLSEPPTSGQDEGAATDASRAILRD